MDGEPGGAGSTQASAGSAVQRSTEILAVDQQIITTAPQVQTLQASVDFITAVRHLRQERLERSAKRRREERLMPSAEPSLDARKKNTDSEDLRYYAQQSNYV